MKARAPLVLGLLCAAAAPGVVMAQGYAWCYANYPDALYCDDFDRYCSASPYPPYPCASGTGSIAQFRNTGWAPLYVGECTEAGPDEDWTDPIPRNGAYSLPFSAQLPCQADAKVGANARNLTVDIQRKWGAGCLRTVATDAAPLHVDFTFYGQTVQSKMQAANVFLELAVDTDFAMTNHVWGPVSPTTGKQYPILCAQGTGEPTGCPSLNSVPLRASLAVGAVSFLDRDYLNSADQTPKTDYLCFYDGRFWWQLRAGQFPGSGDFTLWEKEHYVRLTIYATHVRVEMTAVKPSPDQYSWCEIPRQYMGGFNTMRMGFGKACAINSTSWTACQGNWRCPLGSYGAGVPAFDNLVLYGGECEQSPVCNQPPAPQSVYVGGTATFTVGAAGTSPLGYQWQKNLMNLSDGGHYSGVSTATLTVSSVSAADVASYRCVVRNAYGVCYSPEAALTIRLYPGDFDFDNDVDLSDFSTFQYCFSGPNRPSGKPGCENGDLDDDNDVDLVDFAQFQACYNGPNQPPKCPS